MGILKGSGVNEQLSFILLLERRVTQELGAALVQSCIIADYFS